jgi:UDP-N-acetylglucosamine 1-carboxyvinyltransferase
MGASIETIDKATARIYGGTAFHKAEVIAHDIRGGIALTLAALAAKGTSIIQNVYQIDRGYEHLEEKLQLVGAHIERVQEDLMLISTG